MVDSFEPTPIERTPSRVYVNGTRIPVGTVDIHIRKEGPLDFTRYAEFQFFSPFNDGVDYINAFNGVETDESDEQTTLDRIRIDVKDSATGVYTTEFRGYVTGVGAAADGPEQVFFCRAEGWGHYAEQIPASKNFDRVLEKSNWEEHPVGKYIIEEYKKALPDDLLFEAESVFKRSDSDPNLTDGSFILTDDPINDILFRVLTVDTINAITAKTFHSNKHTIADVVTWFLNHASGRIAFYPTTDSLVLSHDDDRSRAQHDAHYLGGDLNVIENNALQELRPVNTMVVNGQAQGSIGSVNPFGTDLSRGEYFTAKARHTKLYRRANETELRAGPVVNSDAQTAGEVANSARKQLKERISETTGGGMTTQLRGGILPFDLVQARPTCQETAASDTQPIVYEVDRVHHEIPPSGIPKTNLNVGIKTLDSEIELVREWDGEAEEAQVVT